MFGEWLESLGEDVVDDCEFHRCGMAVLPPVDLHGFGEWGRRFGMRAESIPVCPAAGAAESCVPTLERRDEGLIWLPDVWQVRPPRVLRALRKALGTIGKSRFVCDSVVALESVGRDVVAARTASGGRLSAGGFVVAAGAWSAKLLPEPKPDVRPLRGHMALYRIPERGQEIPAFAGKESRGRWVPAFAGKELEGKELGDEVATSPVVLRSDGLYLVPRKDGLLLAGGGTEDAGFDLQPNPDAVSRIRGFAESVVPGLSAPLRVWTGLRPASPGNVPVVARHPARDNLFVHAGHFRYGLTMAPATAEDLAEMVCEK